MLNSQSRNLLQLGNLSDTRILGNATLDKVRLNFYAQLLQLGSKTRKQQPSKAISFEHALSNKNDPNPGLKNHLFSKE